MITISIIVPVYRVESYLRRCVDSILAQTCKDFELILVDDCSPDRSGAICDAYARKDDRVKVIHLSENKGLFAVRKVGIECASGDWVTFVDSDDYIDSDRLSTLLTEGERTGADVVWGDYVSSWEDTGKFSYVPSSKLLVQCRPMSAREYLQHMIANCGDGIEWHVVWAKIYRKEVARNAAKLLDGYMTKLVMCEDVIWSAAFACSARRIAFAHGSVYYYFRNAQASTSLNDANHDKYLRIANDLIKCCDIVTDVVDRHADLGDVSKCYSQWLGRNADYLVDMMRKTGARFNDVEQVLSPLLAKLNKSDLKWAAGEAYLEQSKVRQLSALARWHQRKLLIRKLVRIAFFPLVVLTRPLRHRNVV